MLVFRMNIKKNAKKKQKPCHFKLTFQQGNTLSIDGNQGYEVAQYDTARQKNTVVILQHKQRLTMY